MVLNKPITLPAQTSYDLTPLDSWFLSHYPVWSRILSQVKAGFIITLLNIVLSGVELSTENKILFRNIKKFWPSFEFLEGYTLTVNYNQNGGQESHHFARTNIIWFNPSRFLILDILSSLLIHCNLLIIMNPSIIHFSSLYITAKWLEVDFLRIYHMW